MAKKRRSPYAPAIVQPGEGSPPVPSVQGSINNYKARRRRRRRERERYGPVAKDHGTTPDGSGVPRYPDNWTPA
jgi:hypothetical protein